MMNDYYFLILLHLSDERDKKVVLSDISYEGHIIGCVQ